MLEDTLLLRGVKIPAEPNPVRPQTWSAVGNPGAPRLTIAINAVVGGN